MNLKIYKSIILAAVIPFTACDSDDHTYTPGEQPAKDCPEVYFQASNPKEVIFSPDDSNSFDITLGRKLTDGELTVPITVVSAGEGITVPQTVTFAAGEATATLSIDASGVKVGVPTDFEIALAEEYVNHYADNPGSTSFVGTAICAQWELWIDNITFEFETRYQPITGGQIYQLPGVGRYYIPNFLNTGLPLYFTMENSKQDGAYRTIDPYKNAVPYYDEEYEYSFWYFYDEDKNEYPYFEIQEGEKPIKTMEFYGTDSSNYYYTYICPDYNVGMFGGLFFYDDIPDGEFNNVSFYW